MRALMAMLAAVIAGLLALSGITHSLELGTVDARFAVRGHRADLDRRVLIAAIDPRTDRAIGRSGQFPIPRRYYATALDDLAADGARAVGIDVEFTTQSDATDDNVLIRGLTRHPGTVLAATSTSSPGQTQVLGGPSGQAAAHVTVASALFQIDSGATYRRFNLRESGLPTMAVALAERSQPGFSPRRLGRSPVWIDFPGPPGTAPTVSFLDLIRGAVPASAVRGRVVLIGVTDPGALDLHSYSSLTDREMTGVELEADAAATVLAGAPLRLVPWWVAWALTLLGGVLAPVIAVGARPKRGIIVLLAGLALYLILAQVLFDAGAVAPVMVPFTTLLLAGATALVLSFRLELAHRRMDLQLARRRAVDAADDARRRVERDLHDGVQQRLVALAMRLAMPSAKDDPDVFEGSVDELRVALGELRQLARGTYPAVLSTSGLAGGLESLADHCSLPVDLSLGPLESVSPDLARTAYFVASEAFANALKHSGASRLVLTSACQSGTLVLSVSDDGCGGADVSGSGLSGIVERAEAQGGTLAVDSAPGVGTQLVLRVPLTSEAQ